MKHFYYVEYEREIAYSIRKKKTQSRGMRPLLVQRVWSRFIVLGGVTYCFFFHRESTQKIAASEKKYMAGDSIGINYSIGI